MKISNTLQLVLAAALCASSTGLRANKNAARKLQQEDILAYSPLTQVTDIAALDLDQIALDMVLNLKTPQAMAQAQAIYTDGGFSQSYAVLTLSTPLEYNLTEGTLVSGQAFVNSGGEARGYLMEALEVGATEVSVRYETSDTQRSYVRCQVGASPNPTLDECFATQGTLTLGGEDDPVNFNVDYSYNPVEDNRNGRTLQSLSTQARETMYECENCPYPTYQKFFNYYSTFDYGNQWVMAAFGGTSTNFANGNIDFSNFESITSDGVIEGIRKGTVFLNVFMEVIKSMEDAVHNCHSGCPLTGCNGDNVNAWDKAVAYYVGSMAKVTNGQNGEFLHNNADRRCRNFGTCTDNGAQVNEDIMAEFLMGQRELILGNCAEAETSKDRVSNLMAVPMLQGTLRFAYLMDRNNIDDERAQATGAVYAAAVLPLVHACSPVDSQLIHSNMMVGAMATSFEEVKNAFERNYQCMGLTCADVGGLLSSSDSRNYVEGAEPCLDGEIEATTPSVATTTSEPTNATTTTTSMAVSQNATFGNSTLSFNGTTTETDLTVTSPEAEATAKPDSTVDSVSICPPCSAAFGTAAITPTKTVEECPALVADQFENMPRNCGCACFVDSEFAFCASSEISYTGTGSLVGPCEVMDLVESMEQGNRPQNTEEYPVDEGKPGPGDKPKDEEYTMWASNTTTTDDVDDLDIDSVGDPSITAAQSQSSATTTTLLGGSVAIFLLLSATVSVH